MRIEFNKVMPHPLAGISHQKESIWDSSFQIQPGEKVLLNASSGKGKSTFTYVLYGLRTDYSGEIKIDGQTILNWNEDQTVEFRTKKMAVVFQDLQLFPNLTVAENLNLKNQLTQTFTEEQLKAHLEYLGIADKWEQKCGLLSMGQRQRVAILRALSQPFECILLDEPFSHLDKENAHKCLELINKRCDEQDAGFILTSLGDTYDFNYDKTLIL
jgi:ABC-type lipoprotein export system ATPase subunit